MFCTLVSRLVKVELFSKERAFPVRCCPKQKKVEGNYFLKWASIAPTESCVTYAIELPELDLLKSLGQSFFPKTIWNPTQISYKLMFNLDLVSQLSGFRPVLFWFGLL